MPPPPPAKRPGVPRLSFKARGGSGPGEHHDAEEGDSDGGDGGDGGNGGGGGGGAGSVLATRSLSPPRSRPAHPHSHAHGGKPRARPKKPRVPRLSGAAQKAAARKASGGDEYGEDSDFEDDGEDDDDAALLAALEGEPAAPVGEVGDGGVDAAKATGGRKPRVPSQGGGGGGDDDDEERKVKVCWLGRLCTSCVYLWYVYWRQ